MDSGNLACYLILAGQMLDELLDRPRLDRETLSGYLDSAAACLCRDQQWHRQTMESLAEALVDPEGDPGAVIGEFLPDEVADTDAMGRALIEQGRELQALMRLARAYGIKTDALTLRRAAELPDRPEVRGDDAVRAILRQCRGWCVRAATLRSRMKVLTGGMNFAVLYNREKKLFHIGYDIDRDQFRNSFYDLLGSEARLTSLFTIASGRFRPGTGSGWADRRRPTGIVRYSSHGAARCSSICCPIRYSATSAERCWASPSSMRCAYSGSTAGRAACRGVSLNRDITSSTSR